MVLGRQLGLSSATGYRTEGELMSRTTQEVMICQPCAMVLANGECGECQNADRECTHGGNEQVPAMDMAVGDELDTGWLMGRSCWLCCEYRDGDDWYSATWFEPSV